MCYIIHIPNTKVYLYVVGECFVGILQKDYPNATSYVSFWKEKKN